ncbi:MAG: tetratricopeptide repeat protein [Kofleriaceae bacterium]
MRAALIIALLLLTSTADADPRRDLDKAIATFKSKDWQSAAQQLNFLLRPQPQLASASDLVEAYVLLGVCQYEMGNRERAKTEFEAALALQPDRSLDSLLFSEGAIRVFDETKRELQERAKREEDDRKVRERLKAIDDYLKSRVIYETHPFYMNFFPFGLAQLQNKQPRKAVLFALGHTVTGIPSLGIWLYLATKYGLDSTVPETDAQRVRTLQQIEIATGVGFLGLYAWSVIDAYMNYQPRVQIKADDSLLPPELREPLTPPKKTSLRERLHFGPILTPSGAGIGLSLETY